jgi:squalene-associated FAD-dependent desaturase
MSSKSVIVIGGGLAGLSSAVALADAGFRVRLLEQRPFLGGRAASYDLPGGEHVDNCQHVTLGCCTNLDDFYRRVGAGRKIAFYDRLLFADSAGRRGVMQASPLPAPLHLAPALVLYPFLTWAERHSIGHALMAIARRGERNAGGDGAGESMLDWLRRHGQTHASIHRFWNTVLVSALNEELGRMDARYGLDVFWKAFLSNRAGYLLGIPRTPLGELYDGCGAAIEGRGGEVALRAPVRALRVSDGRVAAVQMDTGRDETADLYVLAVPHQAALDLLPAQVVEQEPIFANLRRLRVSPITGVHFWFDRDVMAEPFFATLDTTTQWIFNKSRLYGQPGGRYLQLVISASYDLMPRSRQEIIDICRRELRDLLPATREANLVKATVIKEAAATFSPEPGSDRWRPSQRTPLPNLFLAGDWTKTDWPATMEGAVRSGYLAAEAILSTVGAPRRLLRPDLPAEGLVKWLASPPARHG